MQHMASRTPIALTPCVAGTLRRASRSLARLYDAHLSNAGLTTSQFSILRTIERHGGRVSLADLAEELVFERTSLYRALLPLRRAGLIGFQAGADRRAKEIALTPRAGRKIAAAMPHWIAAQHAIVDELGPATWQELAGRLSHLTAVARESHAE
jgi:DNA-binding MarR family transcriptional regulator